MGPLEPAGETEIQKLRRQGLLAGAQSINDQSGDLLRWSLGSLLAVNGGALVALLGASELREEAFKEAALLFGGGMLAALIGGSCWSIAAALYAADGFRRAWDPRPITPDELIDLKTKKTTKWWMLIAICVWLGSLGLFALGCISTAYVPEYVKLEKLSNETREGVVRLMAETKGLREVVENKHSTPDQRQTAFDRVRSAQIESEIRISRLQRALGQEDDILSNKIGAKLAESSGE